MPSCCLVAGVVGEVAAVQVVHLVLQEEPLSPLQEDFRALRRAMLQKGDLSFRTGFKPSGWQALGLMLVPWNRALGRCKQRADNWLSGAGLFRSSKSYYLYKTGSTFAILAVALAVLVRWHESMWGLISSAFLLGLFWQQGGWLAHDYLHHQVSATYLPHCMDAITCSMLEPRGCSASGCKAVGAEVLGHWLQVFRHRAVNNAFGYFIGNVALVSSALQPCSCAALLARFATAPLQTGRLP